MILLYFNRATREYAPRKSCHLFLFYVFIRDSVGESTCEGCVVGRILFEKFNVLIVKHKNLPIMNPRSPHVMPQLMLNAAKTTLHCYSSGCLILFLTFYEYTRSTNRHRCSLSLHFFSILPSTSIKEGGKIARK